MKNLKKLVIASFMLVIAFVAVVSSTYAWFTQGTEANVNNIEIGVTDASKALLISKNGQQWSRALNYNFKGEITPVTLVADQTSESKTVTFEELYLDEALAASQITEAAAANTTTYPGAKFGALSEEDGGETKGYLKLDIYLQLTVKTVDEWANTNVLMNLKDVHAYNMTADTSEGAAEGAKVADENDPNNDALSSYRLAVVGHNNVIKGIFEEQSTGTGRYGSGKQFANGDAWMSIYKVANLVQGGTGTDAYQLVAGKTDASSNSTTLVKDIDDATAGITYNNVVYEIQINANDADIYVSGTDTNALTRTLHVVLYVWMEGWDGDNVNSASGCQYQFAIDFMAR